MRRPCEAGAGLGGASVPKCRAGDAMRMQRAPASHGRMHILPRGTLFRGSCCLFFIPLSCLLFEKDCSELVETRVRRGGETPVAHEPEGREHSLRSRRGCGVWRGGKRGSLRAGRWVCLSQLSFGVLLPIHAAAAECTSECGQQRAVACSERWSM